MIFLSYNITPFNIYDIAKIVLGRKIVSQNNSTESIIDSTRRPSG